MTSVSLKGPGVRQAYREVLRHIRRNGLVAGSRLPVQEELVRSLNLSTVTISRAMEVLADEGVLKRTPRVGTVVCDAQRASQVVWTVALAGGEYGFGGFHATLRELVRHELVRSSCVDLTFLRPTDHPGDGDDPRDFVGLVDAITARGGTSEYVMSLARRLAEKSQDALSSACRCWGARIRLPCPCWLRNR